MDNKNMNETISKTVEDKMTELLKDKGKVNDVVMELLTVAFGKEWAEVILSLDMSKVDNLILSMNDSHLPNKEEIFKSFSNVKLNDVKLIVKSDYPGQVETILGAGDLSYLEKQGVFILPSILTTEKDNVEAHKGKGWEEITEAILNNPAVSGIPSIVADSDLISNLHKAGIKWESNK